MVSVAERAKALAALEIYVFPVLVTPNPENPYKTNKRPAIPEAHPEGDPLRGNCTGQCGKRGHGFWDAAIDPGFVDDLFERYPNAHIGVDMGRSGLVAADFDVKRSPEGEIEVDGFDNFELSWLDLPETFSFDSVSGAGGKQFVYAAPEGVKLGPAGNYRKIQGVDRRGGPSYSVWNADAPTSRDVFTPAPEWLLDPATVRDTEAFDGTVKEWLDSLEPGEPSLIVRAAMDRTRQLFEEQGNDFDHAALVDRQFEAIRLGSEGHPGVPQLLDLIEELFYARTGSHSRGEDQWAWEWSEALSSGIKKHGAAIELRSQIIPFDLSKVPSSIPDHLITGSGGTKETFRQLLATAAPVIQDDIELTSLLWGAPKLQDLVRDWGVQFVHERVTDYRERPEPVRENPSLAKTEPKKANTKRGQFLTAAEEKTVKNTRTFINVYTEATQEKGFTNFTYAPPAAWTILSMAYGYKAFIPLAKSLEVNTWFIVLGESTTGKGTEDGFLRAVLNAMFLDGESENYNLGALSSPDGLHMGLINRDGKSSIIHNDEAADFFRDIRIKDWMASVPDKLAKWYDGFVEPSSKISLKELRGKSARTSLNQLMWGTPERMLTLMDASQFDSGYLARVNWVWDKTIPDPNRKSDLKIREGQRREVPDSAYELAADLSIGSAEFPERFGMKATEAAQARLNQAADDFRATGRTSPRWNFIKPAVDRLVMETLWKCAALVALYEGRTTFTYDDTLTAIHYGGQWLRTVMEVSESISESPYSRDLAEIESFVTEQGGTVTRASLLHAFRGKVLKTQREVDDKINYLIESGRLLRVPGEGKDIVYKLNV